jgi:hypothetical protein
MPKQTAQEVFAISIKNLPPSEKLRLAALILEDLTKTSTILVEESDEWSEEDMRDLVAYSTSYAGKSYPEEDSIA